MSLLNCPIKELPPGEAPLLKKCMSRMSDWYYEKLGLDRDTVTTMKLIEDHKDNHYLHLTNGARQDMLNMIIRHAHITPKEK